MVTSMLAQQTGVLLTYTQSASCPVDRSHELSTLLGAGTGELDSDVPSMERFARGGDWTKSTRPPCGWSFQSFQGFPGSPVVKTLSLHCKGHGFSAWLGN